MKKLMLVLFIIKTAIFAQQYDALTEECAHNFAGDFYLKSSDTLNEDVTVSGGNATIDGLIKGDLAVMGGSVKINGTVDGDIAVFGGEIKNYGKITGDVAVAGGSVKNIGRVEGDIAVAGGTVELDSGSVTEGDIAIVGGSVDRSDYAVVNGRVIALDIGKIDKIMPKIAPLFRLHQKTAPLKRMIAGFAAFAFLVVIYILNLLSLLIFPRAIDKIHQVIENNIWIAIAIGIGLEILFVPLIILFAISIIGIPIIPAFVLAFFVGIIFGLTGISTILGERVCQGLNWQIKNRIGLFSVGWICLMIIPIFGILLNGTGFAGVFMVILSFTILFAAATIGIGGVLYAMVRKEK
ncbi:MAG: hypothetical protein ACUVQ3_09270 [bacterium]